MKFNMINDTDMNWNISIDKVRKNDTSLTIEDRCRPATNLVILS